MKLMGFITDDLFKDFRCAVEERDVSVVADVASVS